MANAELISESQVREALARVDDPEIGKPITELGMVESVRIDGPNVTVGIYLTIAGCPMRDTIEGNVRAVVEEIDGVENVTVTLHTMSAEQRREMASKLRAQQPGPRHPFR